VEGLKWFMAFADDFFCLDTVNALTNYKENVIRLFELPHMLSSIH